MKQHAKETGHSRVSITVALSTLMVAVSVLLAGMLVYFGYQRNHEAALLAAEEVLAAVSQQIDDRLLTMVRPIVGIAKLAPILAPIGIQEDGPEPSYQAYLAEVVNHFAQVSSVFYLEKITLNENLIEIFGNLSQFAGDTPLATSSKTYLIDYQIRDGRFYLLSFEEKSPSSTMQLGDNRK